MNEKWEKKTPEWSKLPELCTWRFCEKNVSERIVMDMVQLFESHGFRFGMVTIDDGWQKDGLHGDWIPDPVRVPNLRRLVDWLHNKGYMVRLWIAPVQCSMETELYKKADSSWFYKGKGGTKQQKKNGLETYNMNILSKSVQDYVTKTFKRLITDYNVDGFKVDFPPFHEAGDELFNKLDISDKECPQILPLLYRLIRETCDKVKPDIQIESPSPKAAKGCEQYFNQIYGGDFIGNDRSLNFLRIRALEVRERSQPFGIVGCMEMIWGRGSDNPAGNPKWHSTFLENMAISINYEMQLEHSFPPFEYPNINQIRALNNLYGPINSNLKVLYAGNHLFNMEQLKEDGIKLSEKTSFLVAPENDVDVSLETFNVIGTNPYEWEVVNVLTGTPVFWQLRNENWDGRNTHRHIHFIATGGQVYMIRKKAGKVG